MAPDGRRRTEGTSAQLTNQSRPEATVCAAVQPVAVRSANFNVARSPARSIQLTSTPRFETVNCGCAEPAAAGVVIGCGAMANVAWSATAFAVAFAVTIPKPTPIAAAKAVALLTKLVQDVSVGAAACAARIAARATG